MTQTGTLMVVYYNSAAEDELVGCLLRGPNLNFGGEPVTRLLLLLSVSLSWPLLADNIPCSSSSSKQPLAQQAIFERRYLGERHSPKSSPCAPPRLRLGPFWSLSGPCEVS